MSKCVINNAGGGNGVMVEIINFFINKGFTPAQACGIAGNAWAESKYNPAILNPNDKGKQSFGLFQWRDTRYSALVKYCKDNGLNYKTASAQLQFLWHENSANFQNYYKTHPNMTLMESTKWWKQKWEVGCCLEPRVQGAKNAASVYNQMNKGECVIDLNASASMSEGGSGFSCSIDTGNETTSDLNIVDSSTAITTTTNQSGNTTTTTSGENYNTRPLIITDSTGKAILSSGKSPYDALILSFNNGQTPDSVQSELKRRFSNKNYKPKFIAVWFATGGLKFSNDLNKCKEEVDSFVTYKISAHTGYTNIYWFPSYNLTLNATSVNPDDKGRRTSQYLLNAAAKKQSNPTYHFTYQLNLEGQQNLILNDSYGYRTRKNKQYILSQKAMDTLRGLFYSLSKSFK